MTAYPLMLEGSAISALVVGGGRVATRKVRALVEAGASVHVVAPAIDGELDALAGRSHAFRTTRGAYSPDHLENVTLVVAATDDAVVNAQIATDARARGLLVNVVGAPELGNCVSPAVHRVDDIVIAVSAGRLPTAAVRIRDVIGRVVDGRYGTAVRELSTLRRSMLGGGQRERWTEASSVLTGNDFCEQVESGQLAARIAEWR
jgi:siroheme synthase-like protein